MKKKKQIVSEKFNVMLFKETKKFVSEGRYLLHLKGGGIKIGYYFDLEYLKKVNPAVVETLTEEVLKTTPTSYFIVEGYPSSYCLLEDLQSVYSISDSKIYKSDKNENG